MRAALVCGLFLLIPAVVGPVGCAEIKRHHKSDETVTISIAGEIVEGDAEAFRLEILGARIEKYFVSKVELNSIGGSLYEGTSIAIMIRASSLDTSVAQRDTCASVCFLAFAAGSQKYVQLGARVGVHVATTGTGGDIKPSILGTKAMIRIARLLDVPSEITKQMALTPAYQMFWLSGTHFRSMGAIVTNGE